jgi:hypothetical protein
LGEQVTRQGIGKGMIILALSLLIFAYSNFVPTSLASDMIADYVKNHFVREVIFGITLTVMAIRSCWKTQGRERYLATAVLGSIVVLPFWLATVFGWSTDGLAEVWGEDLSKQSAYLLHGSQVTLFYLGLLLLFPPKQKPEP